MHALFTIKRHLFLWIALGSFALTVLFVNPIRETAMEDDWAFALTVQNLLDTGGYQPHDWDGANMLFQTYWGAVFASIGDYSFSTLRVSTLSLVFLGLIAFYCLAREHGLTNSQSGLLTLGLLSSPLVLRFSFNFMTDVPFMVCLIVTLFLYTRAVRLSSYRLMLLGGLAAAATILTRQFGLALIAGVFSLWVLDRQRRARAPLYFSGLAAPLSAGIWQLASVIVAPNWASRLHLHAQSLYFANIQDLLVNVFWRPTVILQYLALFTIPFAILALVAIVHRNGRWLSHIWTKGPERRGALLLVGLALYALAGILCWRLLLSGTVYWRFVGYLSPLMPYLPGNFEDLGPASRLERSMLTLITLTGAVLFARIFVLRLWETRSWRKLPANERLLDLVTVFLLIEQLAYFNIIDEYLLVFLPFTLIVVGRGLRTYLDSLRIPTAIACFAVLVAASMWTRGLLAEEEAMWKGGELVRAMGVEPREVHGSWTWDSYYLFPDYLASIGSRTPPSYPQYLQDYFFRWIPERKRSARFLITYSSTQPVGNHWEIVAEIPYRNALLQPQAVRVLTRSIGSGE